MAKAIQCDVCGETQVKDQARRWQELRLDVQPVVAGWGTTVSSEERIAHADVCSAECAEKWFLNLLQQRRLFR